MLHAERARQRVEIHRLELDEVRAEAAPPHHLGAERLVDLLAGEQSTSDEELTETRHGESVYQATVTSLQR